MAEKLEVLTRADTTRIVAAATLRARLGVLEANDPELGTILDEITSRFAEFCLLPALALQQYRITRVGNGRELLCLPVAPIEDGGISLTIDGVADTDNWQPASYEQGTLQYDGGSPASLGAVCPRSGWPDGSELVVTAWAGWLMPGVVSTWTAAATYAAGAWVRPSAPSRSPYLMQATEGGDAGATEPTWPALGATVDDGEVTWKARAVAELPASIQSLAIVYGRSIWEGRDGVTYEQFVMGGQRRYDETGHSGLPLYVERGLSRYRLWGA